jgi:hypothetical protein
VLEEKNTGEHHPIDLGQSKSVQISNPPFQFVQFMKNRALPMGIKRVLYKTMFKIQCTVLVRHLLVDGRIQARPATAGTLIFAWLYGSTAAYQV